jgi:hypothetical protein
MDDMGTRVDKQLFSVDKKDDRDRIEQLDENPLLAHTRRALCN